MTAGQKHIAEFNALDGRTVSVSELKLIKARIDKSLKREHNFDLEEISRRLAVGIEKAGKDDVRVKIQSVAKVIHHEETTSFYGVEHIADDKDLDGKPLDGISDTTYKVVTDKIIKLIQKDGLIWRKPWNAGIITTKKEKNEPRDLRFAHNYVTRRVYRGSNFYLNWLGFSTPYFFTFKQVTDLKGKVKKGAEGCPVIYFKMLYRDNKANKLVDEKVAVDDNGKVKPGYSEIPGLFYYTVFNYDQTEGIVLKVRAPRKEKPKPQEIKEAQEEAIESCEKIVEGMPMRPPITHENGDRAFYRPSSDSITMPLVKQFKGRPEYYATLFHELVHSTGAPNRLDRDLSGRKFDPKYCHEELIAEVGACFLCAEGGILYHTLNNAAAYVKDYRAALIDAMGKDSKFFITACNQAQKAADFILGDRHRNEKQQKRDSFQPKSRGKEMKKKSGKAQTKTKERKPKKRREASVPGVKASVSAAIDDLVKNKPDKYGKKAMAMSMLYSTFAADRSEVVLLADDELKFKLLDKEGWIELDHESDLRHADFFRLSSKGATILDAIEGRLNSLRVRKQGGELFPGMKGVAGLGFVAADQSIERQEGMFTLPGEIGALLGEQQRYKLEIVIAGETHSSKSELGKQIADAFCSIGDDVAWVDWEQGGLKSKDTKGSIDRNVKPENKKRFHVSSDIPRTKEALKSLAKYFKVIAVDSGTKLKEITNAWIDELREECPDTVWIILMQQNAKGVARGGPAAEFDAPVVLKTYRLDQSDYKKNYAYVFKNRGNKTGLYYSISGKKILSRNPEDPEPEPQPDTESKARVTL